MIKQTLVSLLTTAGLSSHLQAETYAARISADEASVLLESLMDIGQLKITPFGLTEGFEIRSLEDLKNFESYLKDERIDHYKIEFEIYSSNSPMPLIV